ncbi:POZ/BTB kelch domain protein [Yokapox virus]|uniref:POZ/BTB kelch domain protein n=1 Tax=Yokapox virus TaxID=1076255 RepID=G3EI89_9POXV|nr:POZ/BTB kelch domain protein [Yokapox virus]AEN03600.1 POZ/BTB kelch domain protein [Yokapox virus]
MDKITFFVDGKTVQYDKNSVISEFLKIDSDFIVIENINYHAFISLMDYIHWKKINVTINNVEMILVAALEYNIPEVVIICEDLMIKNITPINCIKVFMFSKRHNIQLLYLKSLNMIRRNINTVIHFPEFMDLSYNLLKIILCNIDVNIQHEDMTAFVLLKWLSKNRHYIDILEILHKEYMSDKMIECLNILSLPIPKSSVLPITRRDIMKHIIVIEEDTIQNTIYPTINIYSPRLKKWEVMDRMIDISDYNIAVLDNCLYVVGGVKKHRFVKYIRSFDLITKEWRRCIELTFPRKYVGLGVNNGKLYVVGGEDEFTNSSTNIVESWKPGTKVWRRLANMNIKRAMSYVLFVNNNMYVLGGINTRDGHIFSLSSMDCLTKTGWVSKASLPRFNISATVHDEHIYAITRISINHTNDFYIYSVNDNSWSSLNTYFGEHMIASICVYDDNILILGGKRGGYMYNVKNNTWKISGCCYDIPCKCISFQYTTPFHETDNTSINSLLKSMNNYSFKKMLNDTIT